VSPLFDTLEFHRSLPAPPPVVFAAFESVEARLQWAPPAPSVRLVYDAADFRPGGRDRVRCLVDGVEDMAVDLTYERIEKDRLIAYTERLGPPGAPVAVALVTVLIAAASTGTSDLTVTVQLASYGPSLADGYRQGNGGAFDNLARWLSRRAA
jgi:uncharacterized protein YndB with AHSA1/START domain